MKNLICLVAAMALGTLAAEYVDSLRAVPGDEAVQSAGPEEVEQNPFRSAERERPAAEQRG